MRHLAGLRRGEENSHCCRDGRREDYKTLGKTCDGEFLLL